MPTSLKTILEEALTGYALPQPLLSKILEQPGGDHSTEKLGMINSNAKDFNGAMFGLSCTDKRPNSGSNNFGRRIR